MVQTETNWDAEKYIQFIEARTRPARDLLSAIPSHFQPNVVYDLGCGPGNSTLLLKNRWPNARLTGIDSSDNMLNSARKKFPNTQFIQDDISKFHTSEKIDLIFSNAAFQWVNHHQTVIPRLIQQLRPQGILAVQMPNNFDSPAHQLIINTLEMNPTWTPLINKLCYQNTDTPLYKIDDYYQLLSANQLTNLLLWETQYYHEMPNHQAILDWLSGTSLRPIFSVMNQENQHKFKHNYLKKIKTIYPKQPNHCILFSFNRIFMVGHLK